MMASSSLDRVTRRVIDDVPIVDATSNVGSIITTLRDRSYRASDTIYAVDAEGRFAGSVALDALLRGRDEQPLQDLLDFDVPRAGPDDDQEHVVAIACERGTTAIPVVDRDGRLLGAVPPRALLEIAREEHVEDLHRLAGIQREAARDRDALEGPPLRRARHRLPWLVVGLAGSMGAAVLVSRFEEILARNIAVMFFVPTIVYLADAIGTQTEAIVVRGFSISRLRLGNLLANELRTGAVIGATLGLLAFPIVAVAFDVRLALAVSLAVLAAGGFATIIGLVLPWSLHRLGRDPAYGSGPVATIVQDVASLVIYLALASWSID